MARVLNAFFRSNFYQKCIDGSNPFTFMDIFLTFLSIGSFLADIGTDVMVIIQYYKDGHIIWMLLTTSLVCVPSLIVQIFSIRWHIIDGAVSNFLWIIHVFQLGVFQRYVQLLYLGFKVRKNSTNINLSKFHQQQSDICMLRLFESFMESAPQLILQLYIMVSTDEWNPWTGISAVASIFSLSWGIAVYSKAMRNVQPEKNHLSWWGLLFQSLWRIGMVSSRVFSMVLFAAAYGIWLILAMAIHWFCMTVWVFFQNTDFCSTWWEERLYNCVVGIIYCFCYFNIKEGQSRYRMTVYYVLMISQNISFILAFFCAEESAEGLKYIMIIFVPFGIVVGITSMLLYYRFFHPCGPIEFFHSKSQKKMEADDVDCKREARCDCCTLKTCRKLKNNENLEHSHSLPDECYRDKLFDENLNTSKISRKSMEELNMSCTSDLHRSHSLNCNLRSYDMNKMGDSSYFLIHNKKLLASHYRNINYDFRPAAYNGMSSSKIHCSCLVLTRDNLCDTLLLAVPKHSKSLPNLEISLEGDSTKDISSSFQSSHTDLSKVSNFSSGNLTSGAQLYDFRPAAYNGMSSSKIHCSCLVLTRDNLCDTLLLAVPKHSKSLPNLEISIEGDNTKDISSSFKSSHTDLSKVSNFSSGNLTSGEQLEFSPVINTDHIVRIKV